jgi:hypothetical protein
VLSNSFSLTASLGLRSTNLELILLLENARLLRFVIEQNELKVVCDLSESILKPQMMLEIVVGGVQREPR